MPACYITNGGNDDKGIQGLLHFRYFHWVLLFWLRDRGDNAELVRAFDEQHEGATPWETCEQGAP